MPSSRFTRLAAPLTALATLTLLTACGLGGGGGSSFPSNVTIALTPNITTIAVGATQQFTATVSGYSSTASFYLTSGTVGNGNGAGTITNTGLYTAPATPPLYNYGGFTGKQGILTLTAGAFYPCANMLFGCNVSATDTFTVTAPAVTTGFIPTGSSTSSVALGGTVKLQPYAVGSTNTAYTLQVNGIPGGSVGTGTIVQDTLSAGLYTAPAAYPATGKTITITVTSVADSTKSAITTITLL